MTASAGRNRWLVSSILRRERDKVDHDADGRLSSSERNIFFLFFLIFPGRKWLIDIGRDNAVRKNRRGQCRKSIRRELGIYFTNYFFGVARPWWVSRLPCNSKSHYIVADALFIDLLFQHQSGYSTGRLGKKMLRIPSTINPDYLRINHLNAMRACIMYAYTGLLGSVSKKNGWILSLCN